METKLWVFAMAMLLAMAVVGNADGDLSKPLVVKTVKGKKVCDKGWECKGLSQYCCNETISDYFQTYQFENLFSKRNTPVAHAAGFWDYKSFITSAAVYQPHGFGTTGGKLMGMKEVSAFLGHVGSKTSCGYGVATGGPLAWGLCYNKEMSPSQSYCDDSYKYTYPCTPDVEYFGRGALLIRKEITKTLPYLSKIAGDNVYSPAWTEYCLTVSQTHAACREHEFTPVWTHQLGLFLLFLQPCPSRKKKKTFLFPI